MSVRAHHWAALLFAGGTVIATGVWLSVQTPVAHATCGTGSNVQITSPPQSGGTNLGGIYPLHAYAAPTTASGLTFLIHSTAGTNTPWQPIGEASQNSSDWFLPWDSRNVPNGSYALEAVAHYSNVSTLDCASPITSINVNNVATQAPALKATIAPATWQGYIGQMATFSVDALYTDQYGRQSHVTSTTTQWGTSIGSLSSTAGPSTVLTAGPVAGSGSLGVHVSYSGLTAGSSAAIKVLASTASTSGSGGGPTPTPVPNSTSSSSTSGGDAALSTLPTIFRPAQPTNSDPVVAVHTLSCVQQQIGGVRYDAISNGQSQPTTEERLKADNCFTGSQAIPAVLAPVPPSRLTDVDTTKELVTVTSLKNQQVTSSDGKKITGLLISGKGVPSSNVFIYIFSDPLVLRAETDKSGSWSYVLETPLKPGKHEVYAVAAKDSNSFVRTSAVPISIVAAAPGSSDGSLLIESRFSAAQVGFAGLAAVMILASLILLSAILRRRRQHAAAQPAPAATQTFHPEPPASGPPS